MIDITKKADAVILANGEYPTADIPAKILSEANYVVCCDGGANIYIEKGYTPNAIIGDGDSLKDEYKQKFSSIIHCTNEQESNDQTKAIKHLLSKEKNDIAILGATGKREDHTIGNISLLIEYARMGVEARIYTNYGVFIPCKGTKKIKSFKGAQISIFNFTAKKMQSHGLLYPIFNFVNWWQGTLNECTGDTFTIEADGEYLLFLNYPEKNS